MNHYVQAKERCDQHVCAHPLLLSLTAIYEESDNAPNINSVSEEDVRAQRSNYYYTPLNELLLLDIHFNGQNCQDPSHGGSYMDEGTFHIGIGLFPVVVPGDCLAHFLLYAFLIDHLCMSNVR